MQARATAPWSGSLCSPTGSTSRPLPPSAAGATYYAYTEVYSDRDRDVLVAVAADDAARLWINGEVVWQEHGQSAWRMGESQRLIRLNRGVNNVLLRLENGPGHAIWSVLLAPPEAIQSCGRFLIALRRMGSVEILGKPATVGRVPRHRRRLYASRLERTRTGGGG